MKKCSSSHNQARRILEHLSMFFNISMVKLKSLKTVIVGNNQTDTFTQSWWEKQVAESFCRNPWQDP